VRTALRIILCALTGHPAIVCGQPAGVSVEQVMGPEVYPYAIQTRDGKIRVACTSDQRPVINMAVFEESLLLGE
jgi:hypothetical protein